MGGTEHVYAIAAQIAMTPPCHLGAFITPMRATISPCIHRRPLTNDKKDIAAFIIGVKATAVAVFNFVQTTKLTRVG